MQNEIQLAFKGPQLLIWQIYGVKKRNFKILSALDQPFFSVAICVFLMFVDSWKDLWFEDSRLCGKCLPFWKINKK